MENTHGKYPWKIPTENTHGKYPRKIPTENTHGKYPWKIPMENTHGKYPRKIPTENTHGKYPPTENTHGKYPRKNTQNTHGKYPRDPRDLVHSNLVNRKCGINLNDLNDYQLLELNRNRNLETEFNEIFDKITILASMVPKIIKNGAGLKIDLPKFSGYDS